MHLGVLVQPYTYHGWSAYGDKRVTPMTTGDVAQILEARYGVMGAFYKAHSKDIADKVANSMAGALESLLMGQVVDPWGSACQAIQQEFRQFISSKEAEGVGIPGTPTKAALDGVNHRYKHPYKSSNPRRPSFRDTGMYMNSQRTWFTS